MRWKDAWMTCELVAPAAAALVALSTHCAAAAPALAATNVNLRQGPGTTYNVVATIPGGTTIDVAGCNGQWCQVSWQGQNGYVIATSIDQGGPEGPPQAGEAPPPDYVPPPGYYPPPPYYGPAPYYYGYGPYYGYGWRGGGYYHRRW